jgi:hypothetical protein
MGGFVRIDLGRKPVPDQTTMYAAFTTCWKRTSWAGSCSTGAAASDGEGTEGGHGTIVDATIINESSSTKNPAKAG